jgi:hypothetical protein
MAVNNPTAGPTTTSNRSTSGSGSVDQSDFRHAWVTVVANPWVLLGLSVVLGCSWFFAFQASVNTTGTLYMGIAFGKFLHGGQITLLPSYWIPGQVRQLAVGASNVEQQMALGVSLFFEVICGLYSLGYTYILSSVQKIHKGVPMTARTAQSAIFRHRVMFLLSLSIIGFNFLMNGMYGPGTVLGHVIYGVIVSMVAFTFLPLTVMTIRACYHQFRT